MKLVSFLYNDGIEQCGILVDKQVYPTSSIGMPGTMSALLNNWDESYSRLKDIEKDIVSGKQFHSLDLDKVSLLAPVPRPSSCRDGYAFRQHVAAARRNRKLPMIPEFDAYPIFYFTNHNSIQGPGAIKCMPDHFQKLDFELEVATVIGKRGRNIKATDADAYIAGLMIMNDMSARTLQMEEMLLNLGPAKGEGFFDRDRSLAGNP
nr:fumarylacetoacetate hydrolase family protein [Niabella hibiscisoli]